MFDVKYKVEDYKASNLPRNRWEQFKDIVSTNYRLYLLLGLLLAVSFIPYILLEIFGTYLLQYVRETLSNQGETIESINQAISIYGYLLKAIEILSLVLFLIILGGLGRINREISFGNGYLIKHDFILGIKQNAKQYSLIALLMGILIFFIDFSSDKMINAIGNAGFLVSGIASGIIFVIFIPIFLFMMSSNTIYELSFIKNLINSGRFAFKNALPMILFSLIPASMYYFQFIDYIYIRLTIMVVVIIFIIPIFSVGFHLFSLSKYDAFVNEKHYPTIYRKGLYKED